MAVRVCGLCFGFREDRIVDMIWSLKLKKQAESNDLKFEKGVKFICHLTPL